MGSSLLLDKLIKSLQIMPGVGQRSASRIAYDLLSRNKQKGLELANIIALALNNIKLCQRCRNYCDDELCNICSSEKRKSNGTICIVESPSDVHAIELSGNFFGTYFVLHGHLSPIDGIGPSQLALDKLELILQSQDIHELILATNPTIEGDATASYIAKIARKYNINVSKIAQGIPIGGDIDTVDEHTLASSLNNRQPFK